MGELELKEKLVGTEIGHNEALIPDSSRLKNQIQSNHSGLPRCERFSDESNSEGANNLTTHEVSQIGQEGNQMSNQPDYNRKGQSYLPFEDIQHRSVILSIHPEYSNKILSGEKTVELRRRFPDSVRNGSGIFIYSTSPIFAIVGKFSIVNVLYLPVSQIWEEFHSRASIKKSKFEEYFYGKENGVVIEITNPKRFERKIPLTSLKNRYGFVPPQSFSYVNRELEGFLENEISY